MKENMKGLQERRERNLALRRKRIGRPKSKRDVSPIDKWLLRLPEEAKIALKKAYLKARKTQSAHAP